MDDILVSVCCCTYNHEPYIRDCLEGFVKQKTDFPVEYIIHDDASNDKTPRIVLEYAKAYPDKIVPILQGTNQYSQGVDPFSQIVLPRAKGKYIALCEGDDYWTDPLKLQKQVTFMEANPDYSMCFHGADVINQSNRTVLAKCETIEDREYFPRDVFPEWIVPTASILFRKDIVLKYPIVHQEWAVAGDIVLILRCMHSGRVWGMANHMSIYRMHDGSFMASPQDDVFRSRMCKHYDMLIKNFPKIDKDYCQRYISAFHYTHFRKDRMLLGRFRHLCLSLLYSPRYVLDKFLRKKP